MKRLHLKFNKAEGDFSLYINDRFQTIIRVSGLKHSLKPALETYVTPTQARILESLMDNVFKSSKEILNSGYCRVYYTCSAID